MGSLGTGLARTSVLRGRPRADEAPGRGVVARGRGGRMSTTLPPPCARAPVHPWTGASAPRTAGLQTARALQRQGFRVLVLEEASDVGGSVLQGGRLWAPQPGGIGTWGIQEGRWGALADVSPGCCRALGRLGWVPGVRGAGGPGAS